MRDLTPELQNGDLQSSKLKTLKTSSNTSSIQDHISDNYFSKRDEVYDRNINQLKQVLERQKEQNQKHEMLMNSLPSITNQEINDVTGAVAFVFSLRGKNLSLTRRSKVTIDNVDGGKTTYSIADLLQPQGDENEKPNLMLVPDECKEQITNAYREYEKKYQNINDNQKPVELMSAKLSNGETFIIGSNDLEPRKRIKFNCLPPQEQNRVINAIKKLNDKQAKRSTWIMFALTIVPAVVGILGLTVGLPLVGMISAAILAVVSVGFIGKKIFDNYDKRKHESEYTNSIQELEKSRAIALNTSRSIDNLVKTKTQEMKVGLQLADQEMSRRISNSIVGLNQSLNKSSTVIQSDEITNANRQKHIDHSINEPMKKIAHAKQSKEVTETHQGVNVSNISSNNDSNFTTNQNHVNNAIQTEDLQNKSKLDIGKQKSIVNPVSQNVEHASPVIPPVIHEQKLQADQSEVKSMQTKNYNNVTLADIDRNADLRTKLTEGEMGLTNTESQDWERLNKLKQAQNNERILKWLEDSPSPEECDKLDDINAPIEPIQESTPNKHAMLPVQNKQNNTPSYTSSSGLLPKISYTKTVDGKFLISQEKSDLIDKSSISDKAINTEAHQKERSKSHLSRLSKDTHDSSMQQFRNI